MNKTELQIRQMQPSDFSEVLSVWEKAGLDIPNPKMEFADTDLAIKINSSSCLVLIKNKKIIGAVLGTFNGRRGWIYHLAIHPDFQQKGYGALLLIESEKQLKEKGVHRIHLGVAYTNLKVLPFYEKQGYSVVNDALWLGKNI